MIRLFNVSIPVSTIVLIISDTILLTLCYVLAATFALNAELDPWFYFRYDNGWLQLLLVVGVVQAGFYMVDLYENTGLRTSRVLLIQHLCLILGVAFLIQALIGYSQSTLLQLPQWTMVYGSLLVLVVIPLWRIAFFAGVRRALPSKKLLFLGNSLSIQEITQCIEEKPDMGFQVVGYLSKTRDFAGSPWLGGPENLSEVCQKLKPDSVVVGQEAENDSVLLKNLLGLKLSGINTEDLSTLYEAVFGRVSIRDLEPSQRIAAEMEPSHWKIRLQNLYSFLLGLIGLILALPVMLVVALLVKITSPGPVFYSQQRVGLYGRHFFLYKFRSMSTNAESKTGPVWAQKNDPRITPLGRWLRLLRLDELPQFYNVLRGDMALVGPRPERPEFCSVLEQQIPFYQQRHFVKPGITGWAQINHKYSETIEDSRTKLEYDLYYVKHLAPALDAYIIFHTLKVMVLFKGAQ